MAKRKPKFFAVLRVSSVAFPDNVEIQAVLYMNVYNFDVNFKNNLKKTRCELFVSALQFTYNNR